MTKGAVHADPYTILTVTSNLLGYTDCSYFQIEWANCLFSSNELHLRFISVICAPRAHENQKWGARAPLCPMVSAPMPLPLTVSCFDIEIQIGFTLISGTGLPG